FYPEDATIQALRAGDVLVVTFPGEVGSSLGEAVRSAAAKATGARQTIVWTLTDHYAGYAFSREDHEEGGKSRHLSAYGPELGDLLVERAAAVAARCWELGGPDPPSKERG
ncbi:MAG: hypothetical protein HY721_33585, partial [Planctomycetes bacterium]|nr:hypothetical protein [Planctomycetota bacterium]